MPRTKGSQNTEHGEIKQRLIEAIENRLVEPGGTCISFREMAAAAGVSVPTLKHYFGTRKEVIAAVMAGRHQRSLLYLHATATEFQGDVRASLRWYLEGFTELAWTQAKVGKIHAVCLAVGMGDEMLGPAYLAGLLEPTLQAVEARLARHVADQELQPCNVRFAALQLMSPVILVLLHQQELGGSNLRPLDFKAFLDDHIEIFLRGYSA